MSGGLRHFIDNFGVGPESPPPPLIPQRLRIPVFTAMVGVGAVLLALLLWFVVIPAIRAQGSAAPPLTTAHPPASTSGPAQ